MFSFNKKRDDRFTVPAASAWAIVISVVTLFIACGAARWSWYTLEEQILIRQEMNELKSSQEQLKIQFDFWDERVSKERMMIREMRDAMTEKERAGVTGR